MIPYKEPDRHEPVRIAIRNEGEWVAAYLVCDVHKMQMQIATIRTSTLTSDEPLFAEWKQMLTGHMVRWLKGAGLNVDSVNEKEVKDGSQTQSGPGAHVGREVGDAPQLRDGEP
jgi:hypothetical protein